MRLLSRLVEGLIILCASVIVTIVTIEVVLRYVFSLSLIFTEELARYLMVWIVFLGGAIAVRDDSHIRINILTKRIRPRLRVLARLIAHGLSVFLLVVLSMEGIKILGRQLDQMCITINISMFYFYLAIPVGSILMIIFILPKIRDAISRKPEEHT
ncbi:MAG: TRAP transporter small permease subunit [Anaerolineales bacterium]|nr:TRAP transporter small permease subunit [Anaerolineales bacterium]